MGRFKSKKRFNNLIIYIGLFIVSIGFSIKYLYQEKLINSNTLVDILINDNLENDKNNITDVDFLINDLLDVSLKPNDEFVNKVEENTEKLEIDKNEIKVSEPLVYIYNTHQEEKYQSTYLKEYNISPTVLLASKILKEYLEDLILNKYVKIESLGPDKYGRILAIIFDGDSCINDIMIKNNMATLN